MTPSRAAHAGARLLAAGALFLFLPGCASLPRAAAPPGPPFRIAAVPFLPHGDGDCGPASLATVLAYLGNPADPAELAREAAAPGLRGTLVTDLAAAARRRGFDAAVEDPSTEEAASLVRGGTPVILLLEDGRLAWSVPHYVVAFGLLPEGLLVRSGREAERVVSWGELERKRRRMGNLALVVRRKGGTP